VFLKRKVIASSLAEVVIAVAVIALCMGIASLVFIRSTKSTINFQDVKKQTEIQSMLWHNLFLQEQEVEAIDDVILEVREGSSDSIEVLMFKGRDNKVIWKQDWWKSE
jgi:hypothetical protein